MSKSLKDILIKWTNHTDSVYMTDNETDPEGVIVSDSNVCSIKKQDGRTVVYFKGSEDDLELLNYFLFNEGDGNTEVIVHD